METGDAGKGDEAHVPNNNKHATNQPTNQPTRRPVRLAGLSGPSLRTGNQADGQVGGKRHSTTTTTTGRPLPRARALRANTRSERQPNRGRTRGPYFRGGGGGGAAEAVDERTMRTGNAMYHNHHHHPTIRRPPRPLGAHRRARQQRTEERARADRTELACIAIPRSGPRPSRLLLLLLLLEQHHLGRAKNRRRRRCCHRRCCCRGGGRKSIKRG